MKEHTRKFKIDEIAYSRRSQKNMTLTKKL